MDDSSNINIGGKISRSDSDSPYSVSINNVGGTQEIISHSDSNPYIPPHLRSGSPSTSSNSESEHSDYSPSTYNAKLESWRLGYSSKEAKNLGLKLSNALNSNPNNYSSDSSSNSFAVGSPGGFNKPWNHKHNSPRIKLGNKHSGTNLKQDLTKKYGSVPSSPQSSQQGFVGFSPKPISSSSSNGLPTPPPPPPVQANQNRTNPNVKEPVKSTVIIIEKKKKESSSSSSDDEK